MLGEAEKAQLKRLMRKLKRKNKKQLKKLAKANVVYPDVLSTDRDYSYLANTLVVEYAEILEALQYMEELSGKALACAQKYAVLDGEGNIKHFKGPPGQGVRFKNCVEYFRCLGKSEERAKGICAAIARAKCRAGAKYACGRRK